MRRPGIRAIVLGSFGALLAAYVLFGIVTYDPSPEKGPEGGPPFACGLLLLMVLLVVTTIIEIAQRARRRRSHGFPVIVDPEKKGSG